MRRKDSMFKHLCSLPRPEDILYNYYPGRTKKARFQRGFRRIFTISEAHPLARRHFKSRSTMEKERIRHLKTCFYIIHPFSTFRLYWEYLMLFVYLMAFIVIPVYSGLVITCPQTAYEEKFAIFDFIQCLICLLDIILNFITGYYSKKKSAVVLVPWKICVHYLFYNFWIDFFTSFPCEHFECLIKSRHTPMQDLFCGVSSRLRLLKFLRIGRFKTYYFQFTEQFTKAAVIWPQVAFLIIIAGLILHWITCVYHNIQLLYFMIPTEWRIDHEIHQPMDYSLLQSQYITTLLLFNVDYGFGPPSCIFQKLYSGIIALIGSLALYALAAFSLRWIAIDRRPTTRYEEAILRLNCFMRFKKLPSFLHHRVHEYHMFRWNRKFFDETRIVSELSSSLREEVNIFTCLRLLKNVRFFSDMPTPILLRISQHLKLEFYLVNDIIVKAGAVGNCMYFIASGTAAVLTETGKEVCHLEDGTHLGEVALVLDEQVRIANVVAVESCELYRLERSDFMRAIAPYPDLLLRIERVAEERLQNLTSLSAVEIAMRRARASATRLRVNRSSRTGDTL